MAMTAYERVKRWREKHREEYNARRRVKPVDPEKLSELKVSSGTFPKMVELAEPVEPELPVVKPLVYRNDYGAIISEAAWKRLQKMKAEAKEKNYELDEYSQL